MVPSSKVDYSRHIREASMAMEKLPEVNRPSGRVPGQRLLAAPILKRQRRRNIQGIGKKVLPRGFSERGVNIGGGGSQGATREPRRPQGATRVGPRHQGAWGPSGSPPPPLDNSGSFRCTDFLYNFLGIYW